MVPACLTTRTPACLASSLTLCAGLVTCHGVQYKSKMFVGMSAASMKGMCWEAAPQELHVKPSSMSGADVRRICAAPGRSAADTQKRSGALTLPSARLAVPEGALASLAPEPEPQPEPREAADVRKRKRSLEMPVDAPAALPTEAPAALPPEPELLAEPLEVAAAQGGSEAAEAEGEPREKKKKKHKHKKHKKHRRHGGEPL